MYGSTCSLTSALAGDECSASRPGRFTPRKRAHGTHWIGGWLDPIAGLDDVEKKKFLALPGLELQPLGRPARSPSLYRPRYPGFHKSVNLRYSLVLTDNLKFKPTSQFVERGSRRCELCIEHAGSHYEKIT
jgi:hypothetical protein